MKTLLSFLKELWNEGGIAATFAALGVVAVLFFVGIFGLLMFQVADTAGTSDVNGVATVVGRRFVPSHTEHYTTTSGNTATYRTKVVADKYEVKVEIYGMAGEGRVDMIDYHKIKNGDVVNILYSVGRFSRSLYVQEIVTSS